MSESNSTTGGMTLVGVLGVVFVTLKLCGVIDWSWWWVTLPFWGGLVLGLTVALVCFLFAGVCWLLVKAIEATEKMRGKQ